MLKNSPSPSAFISLSALAAASLALFGCTNPNGTGTNSVVTNTNTTTSTGVVSSGVVTSGGATYTTLPSTTVISSTPITATPISTTPVTTTSFTSGSGFSSPSFSSLRPSASVLDRSVTSSSDERLSTDQLRALIAGKTVFSQNLDDSSRTQVGTFNQDGTMVVQTGGRTIDGRWTVEGGRVCTVLGGNRFCSSVQRSALDYNGGPLYYFRRDTGEPTVVVTGIS